MFGHTRLLSMVANDDNDVDDNANEVGTTDDARKKGFAFASYSRKSNFHTRLSHGPSYARRLWPISPLCPLAMLWSQFSRISFLFTRHFFVWFFLFFFLLFSSLFRFRFYKFFSLSIVCLVSWETERWTDYEINELNERRANERISTLHSTHTV